LSIGDKSLSGTAVAVLSDAYKQADDEEKTNGAVECGIVEYLPGIYETKPGCCHKTCSDE